MKAGGMQCRVTREDHAAAIRVGAELGALIILLDEIGPGLQASGFPPDTRRQARELGGVVCGMESPADLEIAIDSLVRDEFSQPRQRIVPFSHNAQCPLQAVALAQLFEVGLDAGADLTAIARAATPPGILGIEHHRASSAAQGLQGRAQARVAGTDHRHVGLGRRRRRVEVRTRYIVPPLRVGAEVLAEQPAGSLC